MTTKERAQTAFTIVLIIALTVLAIIIYPPGGMP